MLLHLVLVIEPLWIVLLLAVAVVVDVVVDGAAVVSSLRRTTADRFCARWGQLRRGRTEQWL
jgi:hypothetical protein